MKKILYLLLCVALIAGSVTSCKEDTDGNQVDLTELPEESKLAPDILAEQDLQIFVNEIVSGLEYDTIGQFSEGLTQVVTGAVFNFGEMSGGKRGFIDKTGGLIIPCEYDYVDSFSEGLAVVMKDNQFGYIGKTGEIILPLAYHNAWKFTEGLAAVKIGSKYGFIDKTGKVIIPFEYDYAYPFSEGLAAVEKNGKKGYIDSMGKEIIPFEYLNAWNFSEDLAVVSKGDLDSPRKFGCINKTGEVVVPIEYDNAIESFKGGLAVIWKEGKFGYIDKTGSIVVPLEYDYAVSFSEGLGAVRVGELYNSKWGFINETGTVVIPIEYDYVLPFSESLAAVQKDGKWGYIDKTNNIIVPFEYDSASAFNEHLAVVFTGEAGKGIHSIVEISDQTADTGEDLNGINDINEWENLGLEPAEYWQWHYEYINVFLNKDTERLETLADVRRHKGLYDIYKTLEFGAYTIIAPEELRYHVLLNVDIVSSGVECLPAGNYTFRIEEGIVPGHYNQADNDWGRKSPPQTPAQEALNRWFGTCNYMFYDYNSLSGDLLKWYGYDIVDYFMYNLATDDNAENDGEGLTLAEIQEYAEKYLGIKDFMPPDNLLQPNGKYLVGAHGGDVWFYQFIDETVNDGITSVTIQWFADPSKTIKSHTIEYTMQAVDGGYKFISSIMIYESPYEPWHISV